MKKRYFLISLMSLPLLLSFCLLLYNPTVFAQQTTGLTAMTLVSFSNNSSSLTFNLNNQSIENKTVNYFNNTNGYLVYPSSSSVSVTNSYNQTNQKEKLPAIVMIHENKGLNKYIKDSANILAKHGYVVLAVDLFNGETPTDQNLAGQLTSKVRENPSIAIENMKSAVKYLSSLPNVNASKIASLGWCFGGGQSLQLALNSKDHPLAATVIYYGVPLTNDTKALANIKWPILGIFGDKDRAIPVSTIKQFQKALNYDGITNEIYIYPGVGHAFANPSNTGYAPKETADAWKKTLAFLGKYD
jgi:carboxymethylenebutenolidase